MLTVDEVTEIFYLSDEFSKEFEFTFKKHLLKADIGKRQRNKPNRLSNSEVMTILIAFHLSGMRNLKHFYLFYVCKHMEQEFPYLVSYNRFVELQQQVALLLVLFLKTCRMGTCTGISFIDSTALKVCHREKILKCYAIQGKKQLGDRIFGYLLKSELLQAYTPDERLTVWNQFIGNNIAPSDAKLHANPRLNRSRIDNLTLAEHLESILDFYNEIGLEKAIAIIRKDIAKVSAKA
ncbi:MAG: hypothetical protein LBQ31_03525 [Bacteroidales bacterium]|jgi:hypothetical protein|nr:hypothetical protein [Bacteroidales bacterium]